MIPTKRHKSSGGLVQQVTSCPSPSNPLTEGWMKLFPTRLYIILTYRTALLEQVSIPNAPSETSAEPKSTQTGRLSWLYEQ